SILWSQCALAANTSWSFTLDNTALTFKMVESVNTVTVCGSMTYPATGFTKFTVAASATVNAVLCTTSGALAPTAGTIFYSLQVPGLALITEPIETNEKQLVYAVSSGPCPTGDYNSVFLFNQEDPGGTNNFSLDSQPAFGVFSWTNATSTAWILNLYNLSS